MFYFELTTFLVPSRDAWKTFRGKQGRCGQRSTHADQTTRGTILVDYQNVEADAICSMLGENIDQYTGVRIWWHKINPQERQALMVLKNSSFFKVDLRTATREAFVVLQPRAYCHLVQDAINAVLPGGPNQGRKVARKRVGRGHDVFSRTVAPASLPQ